MLIKYKRKFLVPGNTVKKNFFEEYCKGNCPRAHPSNAQGFHYRCRGFGGLYPPYRECVNKDKIFNEYIVSETEDGEWQCSCKAWTTSKPRKDCKHILKAQANPEKYEVDVGWTGKSLETIKKVTQ